MLYRLNSGLTLVSNSMSFWAVKFNLDLLSNCVKVLRFPNLCKFSTFSKV